MAKIKLGGKDYIEEAEPWMMSYIDMITLLICFFIVIISGSQLSKTKLEILSTYFSEQEPRTMPLVELRKEFVKLVENHNLSDSIKVMLTDRGVEINLLEKVLFASGKSDLNRNSFPVLTSIAAIVNNPKVLERKIVIEGHTDKIPIHTEQFYSNWELSSARACEVVRFYISKGVDKNRLEALGLADTRPFVPEKPGRGESKNRRVMVLIY